MMRSKCAPGAADDPWSRTDIFTYYKSSGCGGNRAIFGSSKFVQRKRVGPTEGGGAGGDITGTASPETCAQKCSENAKCKSFTIAGWQNGGCWMKDKCVKASDPNHAQSSRSDMFTFYDETC